MRSPDSFGQGDMVISFYGEGPFSSEKAKLTKRMLVLLITSPLPHFLAWHIGHDGAVAAAMLGS